MAKIKYYYDTETCKYEAIKTTRTDVLLNILGFIALSSVLAVILVILYSEFYPHPELVLLRKKKKEIVEDIAHYSEEISELNSTQNSIKERDTLVYRQIAQAGVQQGSIYLPSNLLNLKLNEFPKTAPRDVELLSAIHKNLDRLRFKIYIQGQSFREVIDVATQKEQMMASMPAIDPIYSNKYRLASPFGWRVHPIKKIRKFHEGLDLSAIRGTPIYAAGSGIIKTARRSLGGYGNQVEINHGFGYETKYAHMQRFNVKEGDVVKRGQLIGYVGSTGLSVAPHLHYELKINGVKRNPRPFLSRDIMDLEKYEQIIKSANAN